MVCKYYMPKHLRTAKHERDMVGREHIEVVEHLRYIRIYVFVRVCVCVCVYRTNSEFLSSLLAWGRRS
jgi:hypothetical protein